MRQLVYRVQALPQSMMPLVWDFGQLSPEVEKLYIKQIVIRYVSICIKSLPTELRMWDPHPVTIFILHCHPTSGGLNQVILTAEQCQSILPHADNACVNPVQ